MSRLLDALAHWPGRRDVQAVLAADGFRLPEKYQHLVAFEYGNGDMESLARYWDEVAREHVCSAGKVHPDDRIFLGDTRYRSAFLDSLAANTDNRDAAKAGLSLCPCLQLFKRQIRSPGDFGLRFAQLLEEEKPSEFEQFEIDAREWTGHKDDIALWLGRYARALGYERKRSFWRKAIGSSLTVYHGLDRGRRNIWRIQLPIVSHIMLTVDQSEVFDASLTDRLIPGFAYYGFYRSAESAKLGILAHLKLFDAVGHLLK